MIPSAWQEAWDDSAAKEAVYRRLLDAAPRPVRTIVSIVSVRANCLHWLTREIVASGGDSPLVIPVQRDSYVYDMLEREGLRLFEIGPQPMSVVVSKQLLWTAPIEQVDIAFLDYIASGYKHEALLFCELYGPTILGFTTDDPREIESLHESLQDYDLAWSKTYKARKRSRPMAVAVFRRIGKATQKPDHVDASVDLEAMRADIDKLPTVTRINHNRLIVGMQPAHAVIKADHRLRSSDFLTDFRQPLLDVPLNDRGNTLLRRIKNIIVAHGAAVSGVFVPNKRPPLVCIGVAPNPIWQIELSLAERDFIRPLMAEMRLTTWRQNKLVTLSRSEFTRIDRQLQHFRG